MMKPSCEIGGECVFRNGRSQCLVLEDCLFKHGRCPFQKTAKQYAEELEKYPCSDENLNRRLKMYFKARG